MENASTFYVKQDENFVLLLRKFSQLSLWVQTNFLPHGFYKLWKRHICVRWKGFQRTRWYRIYLCCQITNSPAEMFWIQLLYTTRFRKRCFSKVLPFIQSLWEFCFLDENECHLDLTKYWKSLISHVRF